MPACRHPDLEQSLLSYFGGNSTPAHLGMADTTRSGSNDVSILLLTVVLYVPACRHPDLEQSLLSYFGENSTPAHLKMADTPGDDTTRLIPCLADNGSVSPFALVAVRNVFVLPGRRRSLLICISAAEFWRRLLFRAVTHGFTDSKIRW
jgi:hypothetical protein